PFRRAGARDCEVEPRDGRRLQLDIVGQSRAVVRLQCRSRQALLRLSELWRAARTGADLRLCAPADACNRFARGLSWPPLELRQREGKTIRLEVRWRDGRWLRAPSLHAAA